MNVNNRRHTSPASTPVAMVLGHFDSLIGPLAAGALLVGVVAMAGGLSLMADYTFAAGLLLNFAIWFENWWTTPSVR